jgi:hypothetical protein
MGFLEQQRKLARKAGQSKDWQGALNIWEMLCTSFLDSSDVFVGRGDALQALGRLDEAEAAFAEAKELYPKMSGQRPGMLASLKSGAIGPRPFGVGMKSLEHFRIFLSASLPKVTSCKALAISTKRKRSFARQCRNLQMTNGRPMPGSQFKNRTGLKPYGAGNFSERVFQTS